MWTAYKKEIIEKEEENQEFLKLYYQNSHRKHNPDSSPNVMPADELQEEEDLITNNNYEEDEVEDSLEQDEDDWPVQVSTGRGGNGRGSGRGQRGLYPPIPHLLGVL